MKVVVVCIIVFLVVFLIDILGLVVHVVHVVLVRDIVVLGPEEIPILVWGRRKRPPTKLGST